MRTVSITSQWTAAARAIETEKLEPLIQDPLARYLAEPDGFAFMKKYGGSSVQAFVAIRTKFLDDIIESVVNQGPIRQVVLVASGMDTRAYRLKWPNNAVVYEVDHADLHLEKQRRLSQLHLKLDVDRRIVNADLSEDWLPSLYAAGFNPHQPTLWIPEALFFFLSKPQAQHLLQTMAHASPPGSMLALDLINEDLLHHPGTQLFLNALRTDNIPWLFGCNHPESFLLENGWNVQLLVEPGEEPYESQDWPYPIFSREITPTPLNWLIKAERCH